MPPVVLPEDVMLQEERYAAKIEEMEEDQDGDLEKKIERRDSTGSTGYSTCSSTLSSVSHSNHTDRSPEAASPPPEDVTKMNAKLDMAEVVMITIEEIKQAKAVGKRQNIAEPDDESNNADNEETENEKEEDDKEESYQGREKLSAVDFVSQVCANQRCLSAGYKKCKEKVSESLRSQGQTGHSSFSWRGHHSSHPAAGGEHKRLEDEQRVDDQAAGGRHGR